MRRRTFLGASAAGIGTGLAGCAGLIKQRSTGFPAVLDDRPDAVYYPTHVEGMQMIGKQSVGDRTVALFYSYAHRFWNVTNTRTSKVSIQKGQNAHLMASTWDTESERLVPIVDPARLDISQNGDSIVTDREAWPMLSQNMSFHFGENVSLPGDGTYTVSVKVPAVGSETVGAFDGKFGEQVTAKFTFEYKKKRKEQIPVNVFSKKKRGTRGAVDPMDTSMPLSFAPEQSELPGSPVTVGSVGDAKLLATVDGSTLVVSPRTPYNRYSIPGFSLSATLDSVGFDGDLRDAVGPDLGLHYRADLPEAPESGDDLTVTVDGPSQVSRHEGYETAFLERGSVSTTL